MLPATVSLHQEEPAQMVKCLISLGVRFPTCEKGIIIVSLVELLRGFE